MVSLLLPVIYLAFISLGLPDSLLGSAWPVMYQELGTSVSSAGIISMIIAAGTIVSSLNSDRLNTRFGTGKITAVSVLTTAVALFGFSVSHSFLALCLWGIPYGLGAGSVDAALNNYVALHYKARHMSWLHCMWGVGCSTGPVVMGYAINHSTWNNGYRTIALFQIVLTLILFFSLPLWQKPSADASADETSVPEQRSFSRLIRVPGVKEVLTCFFCYCALETTAGLWASSYLTLVRQVPAQTAASFASLFYIGITVGRGVCGFLTLKLSDDQMIRLGFAVLGVGVAALLLPGAQVFALAGLVLVGLGCAPIYPSIIHSTPEHFGADKSQAVIGIQMASAYVGNLAMPPLFGLLANNITPALFPFYLLALLVLMVFMHEQLVRKTSRF
jgi:fucose permease